MYIRTHICRNDNRDQYAEESGTEDRSPDISYSSVQRYTTNHCCRNGIHAHRTSDCRASRADIGRKTDSGYTGGNSRERMNKKPFRIDIHARRESFLRIISDRIQPFPSRHSLIDYPDDNQNQDHRDRCRQKSQEIARIPVTERKRNGASRIRHNPQGYSSESRRSGKSSE